MTTTFARFLVMMYMVILLLICILYGFLLHWGVGLGAIIALASLYIFGMVQMRGMKWIKRIREWDLADFGIGSGFQLMGGGIYDPDNLIRLRDYEWVPSGYLRRSGVRFIKFVESRFWIEYDSIRGRDMIDALEVEYDLDDYSLEENFVHYVRFCRNFRNGIYDSDPKTIYRLFNSQFKAESMGRMFNQYFMDYVKNIQNNKVSNAVAECVSVVLKEVFSPSELTKMKWIKIEKWS